MQDMISDCKVTIRYNNGTRNDPSFSKTLGNYSVAPETCAAIKQYPEYYMAGVCGPDCDPDVITGQALVHPHAAKSVTTPWGASARGTDAWLSTLYMTMQNGGYTGAKKQKITAYVYGFFTHAAGDMFAHTFVNSFADGPFTTERSNMLRHSVVEGYVAKKTPTHKWGDKASIAGIEDFIYKALIEIPSNRSNRAKMMHVLDNPGDLLDARAISIPHLLTRYLVEVQKYSCSSASCARKRASYPLFKIQQPTIRDTADNRRIHFRQWEANIKNALRDWVFEGHKISEALALKKRGTSLRTANAAFTRWKDRHLCKVAGVNRDICRTIGNVQQVMDRIANLFRFDLLRQLKAMALRKVCEAGLGMSCEKFIETQTNPERWFDDVVSRRARNGDLGCIREGEFQQNMKGRNKGKRRCITREGFDRVLALGRRGTLNTQRFAPAFNSIQLSKMVLLPKNSVNLLMRDVAKVLNSGTTATSVRARSDLIRATTLRSPNIMLGWLSSLDASRQWCVEAPQKDDTHQLFDQQQLSSKKFAASNGGNGAFNQLFMIQGGIHPKDDCSNQRYSVRMRRNQSSGQICVLGGTEVTMADGSTKAIEAIAIGDRVRSYDTATKSVVSSTVTKTFTHEKTEELVMLDNGLLGATGYHRVYADGAWVRADELTAGAMLLRLNPERMTVSYALKGSALQDAGGVATYNLAIDGPANFFANGVLIKSE